MYLKKIFLFTFGFVLVSSLAMANMVTQQGVGQVNYTGWGGPSAKVKQEAIEKAKKSAIKKYTASFSTSKMMNYGKIRSKVEADLDRYITEFIVLDDDTDKSAKRYSVVIDASINAPLIEVELQKISAVHNVAAYEKSYLSFVFVAREVISRKSFDARRSQRTVEESSVEESEDTYSDGQQIGYAGDMRRDSVTTTGGSTVQKSDQFEYEVSNAADIDAAMTNIFSDGGYEVVEAVYLQEDSGGLVNVEDFMEDFRFGDDISGATRRNAAKGCRSLDIQYFAIGTLDVGARDIDPVSGMTRVYVSVNGKVMDLRGRFPKTVASVGPVQYAGLGPDIIVARRNALRQAGEHAAHDLTSKMQAKGIK
jgi:hypothetical protein